jgi:hypothetical protein
MSEVFANLKAQLKICQQMFEQLAGAPPSPTSTSTHTSTPTPTPTTEILIPKKIYIKTNEILEIFDITKNQYNNILVRINDILNLNPLFKVLNKNFVL